MEETFGLVVTETTSADVFAQTVANIKKRYKEKTPAKFKKTRQGKGGKNFTYVDRRFVEQWLNEHYADRWSFEVVPNSYQSVGDNIHVLAVLSVMEITGTVRKFQCFGAKEAIPSGGSLSVHPYLKSAESDALKRCAAMLGCAADVYSMDGPVETEEVKLGNAQDIAWFCGVVAPMLAQKLSEERLFNIPKQLTALVEGKLTREQIITNYGKSGISFTKE